MWRAAFVPRICPAQRHASKHPYKADARRDWLPTLSKVAGYNLSGTLPLDGVSQWNEIRNSGNLSPRTAVVLGNSTDKCSWEAGDPRRAIYEGMPQAEALGCGFAIRDAQWKLIQGYGGSPDGTCNSTSSGPRCRNESDTSPSRKECPEGWCLFNVEEDPLELHEVSSEHPDVLKHMQGKMARILTSYHHYEIDPSCPPHMGHDPTSANLGAYAENEMLVESLLLTFHPCLVEIHVTVSQKVDCKLYPVAMGLDAFRFDTESIFSGIVSVSFWLSVDSEGRSVDILSPLLP